MKPLLFRPCLTECEDRLTPASPAQIIADLQLIQMDSAILRNVYNDPSLVTAKGNEQVGPAFMTAIAQQSNTAIADLTPFLSELQGQIATNPALGGLLGAYVGQVNAAIVTAQMNVGYTQFFQQIITATQQQRAAIATFMSQEQGTATPSTSTSTTGTTSPTGSSQGTVNPNGTITVNGANGPITIPNPTGTGGTTGTTTGTTTGSTSTTPTSENTSGSSGTATSGTTGTTTTGTGSTSTGPTSSVSTPTGSGTAAGTGGTTTT